MSDPVGKHSGLSRHPSKRNCCSNLCLDCKFQQSRVSAMSDPVGSHSAQDLRANTPSCCLRRNSGCMNPLGKLFDWLMHCYQHNILVTHQYRTIVQNSVDRFQFHIRLARWHLLNLRNVLGLHHRKMIGRVMLDIDRLYTILVRLHLLLERSVLGLHRCNSLGLCSVDMCLQHIEVG